MSRHTDIDKVCLCAPAATINVDWGRFVAPITKADAKNADLLSPIDAFYDAHRRLNVLVKLVDGGGLAEDQSNALAGQLLLGYVSAAELYLRQVVATSVRLCPTLRRLNRDQQIPYGAVDYYALGNLEMALTERVSFSEPGAISKSLTKVKVEVKTGTSLARSVADFERLCQLRHALVHSHGVVNSTNASVLFGPERALSIRTNIDAQCLYWAATVTSNLVRDCNHEIVRSMIWRWIVDRYLAGDGRSDGPKLKRLVSALGSSTDSATRVDLTTLEEVKKCTAVAISAFRASAHS